jgi:hypothetical protein
MSSAAPAARNAGRHSPENAFAMPLIIADRQRPFAAASPLRPPARVGRRC